MLEGTTGVCSHLSFGAFEGELCHSELSGKSLISSIYRGAAHTSQYTGFESIQFRSKFLAVSCVAKADLIPTTTPIPRGSFSKVIPDTGDVRVTDFLVAVLVMPFSIVYIVKETWIMGQVVCDIWLSVDITCCTCSILHLSAIALDRYRAITDAVEYARKRTPKHAGIMIAVVWIISIFISMPPLFWRHQTTSREDECIIKHDHIVSTIYSTFGAFYIPLALILILYYKIYKAAKTFHRRSISRIVREEGVNGQVLLDTGERSTKSASMPSTTEKTSDALVSSDKINITLRSPKSESKHEKSWKKQRISSTRERKAATTLGPGSLEINLLELITAQIQLTEVPVHFGAAWHLPELREAEEVVLPPPSHSGSVQHCTAQHTRSSSKTAVTTLASTSRAQTVSLGNCSLSSTKKTKVQRGVIDSGANRETQHG
ncbi:hypothetical protein IHE44_0005942 [Lamprotornis superbus]|uniref:G-protein coupled receptors family 1 profile domain-containing protein n=1 Tax=Lamprotornis superbus TaxID=245042 RepID=A0A835NVT3_9PASS|nr:hypothetical protein IHE44_0005942 [Lamprotornis superbus]